MITVLILATIIAPVVLTFSDKIIEHLRPSGSLAKISDEVQRVMGSVNDNRPTE